MVYTGTQENTAFYDINCSPYHRHTPDIAAPYISDTEKNFASPTLTRDFPVQRLFCHVGAHVLLLLELFTEQIEPLFYVGGCCNLMGINYSSNEISVTILWQDGS